MKYLITTDELLENFDKYHIVDLRSFNEYANGHVSGAIPSPINVHLSDSNHNLVDVNMFSSLMSKLGINNYTDVVVYDNNQSKTSCLFWFMLKHYGHLGQIFVLDGGWLAVSESKLPIEKDFVPAPFNYYVPKTEDNSSYVYWLPDFINNYTKVKILDTRSQLEWDMEVDYNNPRRGRIPGSVFIEFGQFLPQPGQLGTFGDLEKLETLAKEQGLEKDDTIVVYCQHGARAALASLALRQVGYTNTIVYEGSMYEWSRHPGLALVTE